MKEERYIRRDGAVHKEFGLTYASFLVIPRTFLMDMPTDWQNKFVKLMNEYNESVCDLSPDYEYNISVRFQKDGKFCRVPEMFTNYRHPEHMDVFNPSCFEINEIKMKKDYIYCLNKDETCIHRRGCKRWVGNYSDDEVREFYTENRFVSEVDESRCIPNYKDKECENNFDFLDRFRSSDGK